MRFANEIPPFKIKKSPKPDLVWGENDENELLPDHFTERDVAKLLSEGLENDVTILTEEGGIGAFEYWGHQTNDDQIEKTADPETLLIDFTQLPDPDNNIPYSFNIQVHTDDSDVVYTKTTKIEEDGKILVYYDGVIERSS